MAELQSVCIDASDRVVAEEQLLQGLQAVKGAAVHLRQAVVLQVPAGNNARAQ